MHPEIKQAIKQKLSSWNISPQVFSSVRWEATLLSRRLLAQVSPSQRRAIEHLGRLRDVKLHWGCGNKSLSGWVNVDCVDGQGVDLVADLRARLPFQDSSVKYIFTEHVLEHIEPAYVDSVLADFYRVLEPGGIARICVPSLKVCMEAYLRGDDDFFQRAGLGDSATEGVNMLFYGHFHRRMYDFPALRAALERAGFSNVRESKCMGSSEPDLRVDSVSPSRTEQTLYVEAIR